jgi:hypothetical protein
MALAQKELNPAEIGPLADMAIRDPEILKQFTATERGKIMRFIASDRSGEFPNRRIESMLDIASQTRQTLASLRDHAGFAGAVGFKGPIGSITGAIPGTPEADFVAIFDTLRSRLTLPRLEMMRGLGAMSEKEFKALSDAATSLSRDMSETGFRKELWTIETTLNDVEAKLKQRLNAGAGGGSAPGVPVMLLDPSGTPRMVPADKVEEFLRRGGRRP